MNGFDLSGRVVVLNSQRQPIHSGYNRTALANAATIHSDGGRGRAHNINAVSREELAVDGIVIADESPSVGALGGPVVASLSWRADLYRGRIGVGKTLPRGTSAQTPFARLAGKNMTRVRTGAPC